MIRCFVVATLMSLCLPAWTDELKPNVVWDEIQISQEEIYELYRSHSDLDNQKLLYQGSKHGLILTDIQEQDLWLRTCSLEGCSEAIAIPVGEWQQAAYAESAATTLMVSKRVWKTRRLARRIMPKNASYAGVIEILGSEFSDLCERVPRLGTTYRIKLPGHPTLEITGHRLLELRDNSWSWYAKGKADSIALVLTASDCQSRPFGSIVTKKGSYWLRPLAESPFFALYKMNSQPKASSPQDLLLSQVQSK